MRKPPRSPVAACLGIRHRTPATAGDLLIFLIVKLQPKDAQVVTLVCGLYKLMFRGIVAPGPRFGTI